MLDEFEIKATGPNLPDRIWTRSNLHASTMIADQAIEKLGYTKAEVVNTFGGDRSDPLYTAVEKKGPCDACGTNACLTDEVICPACKCAGRGQEGDNLSPKKEVKS